MQELPVSMSRVCVKLKFTVARVTSGQNIAEHQNIGPTTCSYCIMNSDTVPPRLLFLWREMAWLFSQNDEAHLQIQMCSSFMGCM